MATSQMYYYINTTAPATRLAICDSKCNCNKKQVNFTSENNIPGYDYIKKLGEGGFGAVNLYRDRNSKIDVAIKSICYTNGQNYHTVLSEYNIVTGIPHTNIIKYYASYYNPLLGKCYIFMEYMPRGSLKTAITEQVKKNVYFQVPYILKAIRDIITGVEHLNKHRVAHCDLKPANILIGNDGVLKICDFGAAHYDYDLNAPLIGTAIYMAPELRQPSMRVNEKTEVYSIGVMLYELCKLQHPYDITTIFNQHQLVQKMKAEQYPPLPAHYGSDMKELLNMMFRADPRNRHTLSSILTNKILRF